MSIVFSVFYWTFVAVVAIIHFPGAVLICLLTAPFDPARTLLHRYTCWWAQLYLLCLPGCRIRVAGREKIRPRTPYVLVANHQSSADIMALSALRVPFKWVSKKEVFRLPFIGWNMYLNQYVCVDRGNVRNVRQTMEVCRRWLERGMPLMIFPEGHRSPDGELQEFHGGAFKLAADCGCAVVPVVVDGTLTVYRGLRVSAFPGTLTIRVLDPVPLTAAGGTASRLRDLVYEQMKQTLAEIRGKERPDGRALKVHEETKAG
jgi:1-acyl-sn-glycerol-3-phosphate acyltransferase